jgi:tripartite-type tricarboxylate transporter receptor subunit TctC
MKKMEVSRRTFLHLAAGAAALPAASPGWAQTYPSRPITIVIAFPPGGSTDVIGRILSERMRPSLGQSVVIENVGGANGSIGTGRVARAAPDGYTLTIGNWNNFVANGALYSLQFDLLNDFKPIALLSETPLLLAAKKNMAAQDLKEFIAWLKANPNKASEGHSGIGSVGHVAGYFFQKVTGTRFGFVPYRGGGPAVQDLVAGNIDFIMNAATDSMQQVRAGSVKAFAVTANRRLSGLPEIPTVDEAGLPRFYFSQWFGLWAPKQTPDNIVRRLNDAVVDALADPEIYSRVADVGQEIYLRERQTPEALAALHRAEIDKWWPIIKEANIKGE